MDLIKNIKDTLIDKKDCSDMMFDIWHDWYTHAAVISEKRPAWVNVRLRCGNEVYGSWRFNTLSVFAAKIIADALQCIANELELSVTVFMDDNYQNLIPDARKNTWKVALEIMTAVPTASPLDLLHVIADVASKFSSENISIDPCATIKGRLYCAIFHGEVLAYAIPIDFDKVVWSVDTCTAFTKLVSVANLFKPGYSEKLSPKLDPNEHYLISSRFKHMILKQEALADKNKFWSDVIKTYASFAKNYDGIRAHVQFIVNINKIEPSRYNIALSVIDPMSGVVLDICSTRFISFIKDTELIISDYLQGEADTIHTLINSKEYIRNNAKFKNIFTTLMVLEICALLSEKNRYSLITYLMLNDACYLDVCFVDDGMIELQVSNDNGLVDVTMLEFDMEIPESVEFPCYANSDAWVDMVNALDTTKMKNEHFVLSTYLNKKENKCLY